jgi:biopolymer transport protein ExbD
MAMNINAGGGDGEVIASINTTPLVDVMLVLLIIFLITIPVAVQTHQVTLPKDASQPRATKAQDINISLDVNGNIFWNDNQIQNERELTNKLKEISIQRPQPEVHIRGDENVEYEYMAKILISCQKSGIAKVGFLIQPPPKS